MREDEIDRLKTFCEGNHECKCFDGTFEEFNECCGKKYSIENPMGILFSMVEQISKKSSVPRMKDMTPEKAENILKRVMEVVENEMD